MTGRLVNFTDSARDAIRLAYEEAETMHHGYVGMEHLLLGLMQEQMGMGGIILRSLGVEKETLKTLVRHQFPSKTLTTNEIRLDLSPGCKRAINRAMHEAQLADHPFVSTEHILKGMISQGAGTAAKLLTGLGLSTGLVEAHIDQVLDKGQSIPFIKEGKPMGALEERYKIESVIGVGGMSTVYRARDLRYSNFVRLVAIKEMQPVNVAEVDQRNIIRDFRQEAGILASLKHPFIPRFYDFFSVRDRFYIVMEYIVGQDLETILDDTDDYLTNRQVVHWGIQLCDVLSYLHSHPRGPIIFRDMKPSNIMVDRYGNVRLIDFNIARVLSGEKKRGSVGTQGYSPPEQYQGVVTPRVDIYALGATLHHLLTKQDPRLDPPFSFDQRPIRQYNPEVNIGLEVVIMRALSYHENQRYTSAEAMKQALIATGIK